MRVSGVIGAVCLGLIGILSLFGIFGSWFTVDQGERSVVLRNGAVVRVAEPGLNFKLPIIESAVDMSIRTERATFDRVQSYSKDIQLADLKITVNHRLDPSRVGFVYQQYSTGYVDRILYPAVQGHAKIIFGLFTAKAAIEERARLQLEIEEVLRREVLPWGVIIEAVQVENIDFSKEFEDSIEQRMKAEVEVAKLQQNWEREKVQADILRTQATAKADAVKLAADAEAYQIRAKGDAEASAISVRAEALKQNQNLVNLIQAEKWDGRLPSTMVPGSTVPFLNVGK